MSAVYYHYQSIPDTDPYLTHTPTSRAHPLRPRVRRRPFHLRRSTCFLATVLILVSLLSYYHARISNRIFSQSSNTSSQPEHSQHPRPPHFDHGAHAHIPHHKHIPNISPTTASPPPTQSQIQNVSLPHLRPSPVVFSLIMFSEDSAAEGAVLIKVCLHPSHSLSQLALIDRPWCSP